MKKFYTLQMAGFIIALSLASTSYAQHTKIKTITIINGDTTINENNLDEKDIADLEKQISIEINDDSIPGKKIVKKISINDDDKEDNAFAYAFSNDDKDTEIEVSNDGNGNKTKIIIKNDGDKSASGKEKKVVRKSITTSDNAIENMSININVKNTTASISIETGNEAPLNISVLDENGKQVFYDSQKNGKKYSTEIKLEKKGTYFLNLIQNKKSTTEKIIVE